VEEFWRSELKFTNLDRVKAGVAWVPRAAFPSLTDISRDHIEIFRTDRTKSRECPGNLTAAVQPNLTSCLPISSSFAPE